MFAVEKHWQMIHIKHFKIFIVVIYCHSNIYCEMLLFNWVHIA